MDVSQIIIIAVVVVALIALYIYWPFKSPGSSVVTPQTASRVATTTITPARITYSTINLQYDYSGPISKNGITCYYHSYAMQNGALPLTLNGTPINGPLSGGERFNLEFQVSSTQCPMQITGINITTPGFSVVSTEPQLPLSVPQNSNIAFQITMVAPSTNFYGPLTIHLEYR